VGLKLNGIHQLLAYADDVNLLGNNINTLKNRETLIYATKEVDLEVNTEETGYSLVSHHQNAGQNWDIKTANRSSENGSQFKYLETTITNQNLIKEDTKMRLHSGNACYHSVQNLCMLLKNVKIRIYKIMILPVVLYGSLTFFNKCRPKDL
jgi:hypothetical protein